MSQKSLTSFLFDMDGTLVDSAAGLAGAVNDVRASFGFPPLPAADFREAASEGSASLLRVGFGVTPENPRYPSLRESFFTAYEARCRKPTLFPGVTELLAALDRKGLVWGIVTNKPQEFAEAIAASTPAMARCAIVVGSRPGVPLKPAPDGILRTLKDLTLKPEQTLYTGDDRRDIEAGKAAGTSTLLALWGYRPKDADTSLWAPDFTASSPEDIIRLLP